MLKILDRENAVAYFDSLEMLEKCFIGIAPPRWVRMPISRMTLCVKTFSIMTQNENIQHNNKTNVTFRMYNTQYLVSIFCTLLCRVTCLYCNAMCHYADCCYAEFCFVECRYDDMLKCQVLLLY
jgi:hypothetical protein